MLEYVLRFLLVGTCAAVFGSGSGGVVWCGVMWCGVVRCTACNCICYNMLLHAERCSFGHWSVSVRRLLRRGMAASFTCIMHRIDSCAIFIISGLGQCANVYVLLACLSVSPQIHY